MDLQGQRDLFLLNEVERDAGVTQRTLATKLGLALGLTNLYLKRLARKGYIKISTIPKTRIKYLLTPRGMAEKSRLTYLYMQYSLSYYHDMRQRLKDALLGVYNAGAKRIVVYGTGELAELCYLSLREMNFTLVGFIDGNNSQTFLSYPVWSVDALAEWDYDAVLVADLNDVTAIHARLLRHGVPEQKILALGSSGRDRK